MATMREIAAAIQDDMSTRDEVIPEILEVREELTLIVEMKGYFDPILWSRTMKRRVIAKPSS